MNPPRREATAPADTDPRRDEDLLAAHVAGDHEAFGVLFARHRDRLWAVALRTAGDPELAADALQEGLIAAFRRAASFRGESAVTTWLHRIVVNATLDQHRRRAVRATESLDDHTGEQPAVGTGRPGTHGTYGPHHAEPGPDDPLTQVIDHERRSRLLEALALLPVEQRAAVVVVDLEGWSVAEAATVLGCAPGTVKSRCARGRRRLAAVLQERPAPPPAEPADRAVRPTRDPDPGREPDPSTERTVPRET